MQKQRGMFDWLIPLVLSLVGVGILFVVGFSLLVDFQATLSNTSLAWYAINNITTGMSNITKQFGMVGTVVGYGLVIGALGLLGYGGYMLYNKGKSAGGR